MDKSLSITSDLRAGVEELIPEFGVFAVDGIKKCRGYYYS
jgi:hypothetical protein